MKLYSGLKATTFSGRLQTEDNDLVRGFTGDSQHDDQKQMRNSQVSRFAKYVSL